MNKKLTNKRDISEFTILCCILYAASYITRTNFSAIISEVTKAEGITKSMASVVTTALFISYGLGQLIFGVIGDRIDSRKLISFGMIVTTILNFAMFFVGNIYVMAGIWFLNGFAQAIMWPSLAKITSDYLSVEGYKKICVSIAVASNVATVGIYIFAPILLGFMHYKKIFLICGAVGAAVSVIWRAGINKISEKRTLCEEIRESENKGIAAKSVMGKAMAVSMIFIGAAICFQGILKDGITTWTPSYIQEIFGLSASFSIFISVILPVFSIISYKFGGYIHRRFIKNEVSCAAVFFATAAVAAVLMSFMYNVNLIICVLLAAIITGCMHGVNLMLICMIPGRFEKEGLVSTVSGTLNFVSYVGSSVSTCFVAKFAEICGWRATVGMWAAVAAAGIIICLSCSRVFRKSK